MMLVFPPELLPEEGIFPRIFLDEQGVLSFYRWVSLSSSEPNRKLFEYDSRLRQGYARSILLLARHLSNIPECCKSSERLFCLLDHTLGLLRSTYERLSANTGTAASSRVVFSTVSNFLRTLLEHDLTVNDKVWVRCGLRILALAAAEYDIAVALGSPRIVSRRGKPLADYQIALHTVNRLQYDLAEVAVLLEQVGISPSDTRCFSAPLARSSYIEATFGLRGKLILQLEGRIINCALFDTTASLKEYLSSAELPADVLDSLRDFYMQSKNRIMLRDYSDSLESFSQACQVIARDRLNCSQLRALDRLSSLLQNTRKLCLNNVPNILLVYQRISDSLEQILDNHQRLDSKSRRLVLHLFESNLLEGVQRYVILPILTSSISCPLAADLL